jgi:hypothetical protein
MEIKRHVKPKHSLLALPLLIVVVVIYAVGWPCYYFGSKAAEAFRNRRA